LIFETAICFKNHEKACYLNLKGWRCADCQIFTGGDSQKIQSFHVCGTKTKLCSYCHKLMEEDHICKVKQQLPHKVWPNLAFVRMNFDYIGSGNCNNCFTIRQNYAQLNGLTLAELFKHEAFSTLSCDKHKNVVSNPQPNIISMYKEGDRHTFREYLMCSDDFDDNKSFEGNVFSQSYSEQPKIVTGKPFKVKKTAQKMGPMFYANLDVKCNTLKKSAISKFLLQICQPEFSNYTFIMDGKSMVIIQQYFNVHNF